MRYLILMSLMIWTLPANGMDWSLDVADVKNDHFEKKALNKGVHTFEINGWACGVGREITPEYGVERRLYCMRKGVMSGARLSCGPRGGEFLEFHLYDENQVESVMMLLRCMK